MAEPMTSPWRRAAAAATALLTVAIAIVVGLRVAGAPVGAGPSATASAAVTSTPSPSGVAASGSPDQLAVFAQIEDQVVELRELPAAGIGPPEVLSRSALGEILADELDAAWTEEQLAADNLALRALGLLSGDQDIRELTEALYQEQVLGFYDFEDKRMVVISDAGLDPLALITYAHEYTHALQDAAFDTGAGHEATLGDDDAALARLSLEEGDATFIMYRWALANLPPSDLADIGATPLPDVTSFPSWMVAQLQFPYLAGLQLVSALQVSGGWDAVDDAYAAPPTTTEQVLHPEKYLAGEEAVAIEPFDLAGVLGSGWDEVDATPVGEAMVSIWLEYLGVPARDATAAAAGWGGDRLTVAADDDGAWAMSWTLAWDSVADADEFEAAYADAMPPDGIASALVRQSPTRIQLVHASSSDLVDRAAVLTVTSSLGR
jgi:hypothetical protein